MQIEKDHYNYNNTFTSTNCNQLQLSYNYCCNWPVPCSCAQFCTP